MQYYFSKLQTNEEADVDYSKVAGDALLEHSTDRFNSLDTDSHETALSKRSSSRAKSMYQLKHYAQNDDFFSVYYLGVPLITASSEHCSKMPVKSISLPQISELKLVRSEELQRWCVKPVSISTDDTRVPKQSEVKSVNKLVKTPVEGAQVSSTCCSSLKKTTLWRLLR